MTGCAFSVIIPTRDRSAQLVHCLESMACLRDVEGGFEVIVVDDGGTEPLDAICAGYRDRIDLLLVKQEASGSGAARNTGATRARGAYLVFTADDCRANQDWLNRLQERISRHPDKLIGGTVQNGLPHEVLATANQLIIDYLVLSFRSRSGDPEFFTPNNMAVPATGFDNVGGFDATMGSTGEDREFCFRWRKSGLGFEAANDAIVHHFHSQNVAGFFRQHIRYGRGSCRFHRKASSGVEAAESRRSILPESNVFYWKLLTFPTTRFHFPESVLLSMTLCLAQIAIAFGFVAEWLYSTVHPGTPGRAP